MALHVTAGSRPALLQTRSSLQSHVNSISNAKAIADLAIDFLNTPPEKDNRTFNNYDFNFFVQFNCASHLHLGRHPRNEDRFNGLIFDCLLKTLTTYCPPHLCPSSNLIDLLRAGLQDSECISNAFYKNRSEEQFDFKQACARVKEAILERCEVDNRGYCYLCLNTTCENVHECVPVKISIKNGKAYVVILNPGIVAPTNTGKVFSNMLNPTFDDAPDNDLVDSEMKRYVPAETDCYVFDFDSDKFSRVLEYFLWTPFGSISKRQFLQWEEFEALLQVNGERVQAPSPGMRKSERHLQNNFINYGKLLVFSESNRKSITLFTLKLAMLIRAYWAWQNKDDKENDKPELSYWLMIAAKQLQIRLGKLFPDEINDEQLIMAQAIAAEIQSRVSQSRIDPEQSVKKLPLPFLEVEHTLSDLPAFLFKSSSEVKASTERRVPSSKDTSFIRKVDFLDRIKGFVKECEHRLPDEFTTLQGLMALRSFFIGLPNSTDMAWQELDNSLVDKTIHTLYVISDRITSNIDHSILQEAFHEYVCEIAVIAYDIAAQLALRSKTYKLGERYTFQFNDVFSGNFTAYNPGVYQTLNRVLKNFSERATGRMPVFGNDIAYSESPECPTHNYLKQFQTFVEMTQNSAGSPLFHLKSSFERALKLLSEESKLLNKCSFYPLMILNHCAHKLCRNVTIKVINFSPAFSHIIVNRDALAVRFSSEREIRPVGTYRDMQIYQIAGLFENRLYQNGNSEMSSTQTGNRVRPLSNLFLEAQNDLKAIEANPSMTTTRCLDWALTHMNSLEDPDIQRLWLSLLLRFGQIPQALKDQQNTFICLIQKFQLKSYEHFNLADSQQSSASSTSTYLWLIKVHQLLKKHLITAALANETELPNISWIDTNELLEKAFEKASNLQYKSLIGLRITSETTQDLSDIPQQNFERLCLCLALVTLCNESNSLDPEAEAIMMSARLALYPQILNRLKDNFLLQNDVANLIIKVCCKTPNRYEWNLIDDQLVAFQGDYVIDLKDWKIQNRSLPIVDILHHLGEDPLIRKSGFPISSTNLIIQSKDESYRGVIYRATSLDGQWAIEILQKTSTEPWKALSVSKNFSINDVQIMLHFDHDSPDISWVTRPSLALPMRSRFVPQGDQATFIVEKKGFVLTRADSEGHRWITTNQFIIPLCRTMSSMTQEWVEFLSQFTNPANATILVEEIAPQRCLVKELSLPLLGLTFDLSSSDQAVRLYSREHAGYHLDTEVNIPALNGFKQVLILRNDNKVKVLLPVRNLKQNNSTDQSDLSPSSSEKFVRHSGYSLNPQPSYESSAQLSYNPLYYEYHLRENGELHTDNIAAKCYLSIFYAEQRDYRRAMHWLKDSYTFRQNTAAVRTIFNMIKNRTDTSPDGVAYNCQFILRMLCHADKWTAPLDSDEVDGYDEYSRVVGYELLPAYRMYMRCSSHYREGISSISEHLRLSQDQIRFIQDQKKKHSIQEKVEYRADIRQKLKNLELNLLDMSSIKTKIEYPTRDPKLVFPWYSSFAGYRASSFERPPYTPRNQDEEFKSSYLFNHYCSLLVDAVSPDEDRRARFRTDIFFILLNTTRHRSKRHPLISLLIAAYQNRDKLKSLAIEGEMPETTAKNIIRLIPDAKPNLDLIRAEWNLPESQPTTKHSPKPSLLANREPVEFDPVLPEFSTTPLGSLSTKYFDFQTSALIQGEFPLRQPLDATPIEVRLFDQLETGHQENRSVETVKYTLKEGYSVSDLTSTLEEQIVSDRHLADSLRVTMLSIANQNEPRPEQLSQSHLLRTALATSQLSPIQMEDLLQAMLRKDPKEICRKNPLLNKQEINVLLGHVIHYALLITRIAQTKEALKALENTKEGPNDHTIQEVGTIVSKKRSFDPKLSSELLYYEQASGRMLHPQQVTDILTIFSKIRAGTLDRNTLLHFLQEFRAGGGKTSVIIPILIYLIMTTGKMPVLFNTNEMYYFAIQEIPGLLKSLFNIDVEVLEVSLEHRWGHDELKRLHRDLKSWKANGKALLIKPVVWHSLNLARKSAYIQQDKVMINAVEKVLNFFREETVALFDEAHLLGAPLIITTIAEGKNTPLSKRYQKLFVYCFDCLFGRIAGTDDLPALSGIRDGGKKVVAADNIHKIQEVLAHHIAYSDIFDKPTPTELENYLNNPANDRPEWLNLMAAQDRDTANLIISARAFIRSILPLILSMQLDKDYGKSIRKGDYTAAPKDDGAPTSAHYADPLLLLSLTILLVEQKGVPEDAFSNILHQLRRWHNKEKLWCNETDTPTNSTFKHILNQLHRRGLMKQDVASCSLDTLSEEDIQNLAQVPVLREEEMLKKLFLYTVALNQVVVTDCRLSSTSIEMLMGFNLHVNLTATAGLSELYSPLMGSSHINLANSFKAQAVSTFLRQENGKHIVLPDVSCAEPKLFFSSLQGMLGDLDALIDRGGLLCGKKPEDVAKAFLAQQERKAIVHFNESDMVLSSRLEGLEELRLSGSNIAQEMAKNGLSAEDLLLFIYFELSRTTGTDVKPQKVKSHAGLTVGKEQTLTSTIQGALRQRLLLDKDSQTMAWIILKSLHDEICQNSSFSFANLITWMICNETGYLEKSVLARAYQFILYAVYNTALSKIKFGELFPSSYGHGLLNDKTPFDPFTNYEVEMEEIDTQLALGGYYQALCAQYGLKESDMTDDVKGQVATVINQTAALRKKIPSAQGASFLMKTIQQEQDITIDQTLLDENMRRREKGPTLIQQKMKQKIVTLRVENYSSESLWETGMSGEDYIPYDFSEEVDIPLLMIHRNNLSPFNEFTSLEASKPIEMLLVQINNDYSYKFFACTAAGAEFFRQELIRIRDENLQTDKQYALIGLSGNVLMSTDSISPYQNVLLETSPEVAEMTTFAAFINGQMKNPAIMHAIITKYRWTKSAYMAMVDKIVMRRLSSHPLEIAEHQYLWKLCGWDEQQFNIYSGLSLGSWQAQNEPMPTVILRV